ncbi:MAG: hypothetical protein ACLUNV_08595 [Sutterella wadsworthensis]
MGDEDGVAKTPEWAAEKTGVPAERIRKLAHDLHEHRTMLMVGWGIQRIQYGEQPHWMAFALASVLGQIGLPGGGIGTNYASIRTVALRWQRGRSLRAFPPR